jgi:uncharacterized protein VirK/YbjX
MNPDLHAPDPVRWPDARHALGEVYASEWPRRLKYTLRCWMTTQGRQLVLAHVAQSPAARTLLASAPRAFYPVMHKHLDRRFDTLARARSMAESMRGMENATGAGLARPLFSGELVTLGVLPEGTRITLGLNRLTFHEGLWAIDLTRADGLRLFTISFGWSDERSLMLGCVQGPPREIDGLESVRQLTDAAHGLRPAYLLMFMLRACAARWGVAQLIGVDEAHQVKGRWNHRAVERHFDYAAFWQEASGTPGADGNWRLPVDVPRRPLEDVPGKRRAMYRRRYALLDALAASAASALA